jgi:hypothetical protein
MLNRTNRTLSAHLNRLNLGTRSLASQASVNNGDSTLHTRLVHPVAVRAGVVGVPVYPIFMGRIGIPSIPGSPSVSSWLIASCAILPRVDSGSDRPSSADWQVNLVDPPCLRGVEPGPGLTRRSPERGPALAERKPFMGKRRQQQAGLAGMCQQATLGPVAAQPAAAGG